MPRVQTYGQRKVDTAPLPGVQRQHASETFESAGGRVGEAITGFGQEVVQAGAVAAKIVAAEQEKANHTFVLTKAVEAKERTAKIKADYLALKGTQVLDGRGPADEAIAAVYKELVDGAKNPKQREALDLQLRQFHLGDMEDFGRHQTVEMDRADEQGSLAYRAIAINEGIANFDNHPRLKIEMRKVIAETERRGAATGLDKDVIAAQVAAQVTEMHVGVIHQYLATGQDAKAKHYYEEAESSITGDKRGALKAALEEGSVRGDSQRASDKILATTTTLKDAMAQVKAIADPKRRDETQGRIEHAYAVKDKQDRDAHEALTTKAVNIADQTGDWRAIPPPQWTALTIGERAALKAYTAKAAKAEPIETDPDIYYQLSMAATSTDPTERTQFLQTNLLEFVADLSIADRKHFMDAQGAMRKGDVETADKLLVNATQQNRMVDEALVSMNLDPTPPQPGTKPFDAKASERIGQFRRSVREAVTRIEARPDRQGKPATDAEVQSIVDQLRAPTGERVTKPGTFWDTKAPAYAFETAQAQVAAVADVPIGERRQIEAALRARNKPITDAAVLALFNLNLSITRKDR